ncbi:protein phosphatase inhibitor 2-like [Schistocerca gregaria]|uniref:protein phosphatase inhibitor 2-like n=1 Tax=Schistocerca gregaria TaxID=7010 RepID=UPI00211DD67F|nr:protein phosphatase inhibitor 2-like [Schistocerca gregaria]
MSTPLESDMNSPGKKKRKGISHITWDEDTIREHDKDRGTRQKIDEPKTPYTEGYSSEEDNHSQKDDITSSSSYRSPGHLDQQELARQMAILKDQQDSGQPIGPNFHSLSDEEDVHRLSKKEFELKRKLHYDEFKRAKSLQNAFDDDEDDSSSYESSSESSC